MSKGHNAVTTINKHQRGVGLCRQILMVQPLTFNDTQLAWERRSLVSTIPARNEIAFSIKTGGCVKQTVSLAALL
jgi:hypothetical protein